MIYYKLAKQCQRTTLLNDTCSDFIKYVCRCMHMYTYVYTYMYITCNLLHVIYLLQYKMDLFSKIKIKFLSKSNMLKDGVRSSFK